MSDGTPSHRRDIPFGLVPRYSFPFQGKRICSFTKLNTREYLISTSKGINYFKDGELIFSNDASYMHMEYIPELNLIAAITTGIPTLVFFMNNRGLTLLKLRHRLEIALVNQIIYSNKTRTLIISGRGIQVFNINVEPAGAVEVIRVVVEEKWSALNALIGKKVFVDHQRERIMAIHEQGYTTFTFDGSVVITDQGITNSVIKSAAVLFAKRDFSAPMTKANPVTYAYKRMLISDSDGNIKLVHSSRKVVQTYITSAKMFADMFFVTPEFAICLSYSQRALILDVKTMKFFEVPIDKPTSWRFFEGTIAVQENGNINVYDIILPWKLYIHTASNPISISRHFSSAPNTAARIMTLVTSGIATINSPDGDLLVSAGSSMPEKVQRVFYDRGCIRYNSNIFESGVTERILMITSEGSLMEYIWNEKEWVYKETHDLQTLFLTPGAAHGKTDIIFVGISIYGDLLTYDYKTLKTLQRIPLDMGLPLFVHYHFGSGSLILILEEDVVRYNMQHYNIRERISMRAPKLAAFEDDLCAMAFPDHRIVLYDISKTFTELFAFTLKNPVKILTISYHILIAVTVQNEIIFGSSVNDLTMVQIPFEIFTVSIKNPSLDILIGLDKEIMTLSHKFYPNIKPIITLGCDIDDRDCEELLKREFKIPEFENRKESPKRKSKRNQRLRDAIKRFEEMRAARMNNVLPLEGDGEEAKGIDTDFRTREEILAEMRNEDSIKPPSIVVKPPETPQKDAEEPKSEEEEEEKVQTKQRKSQKRKKITKKKRHPKDEPNDDSNEPSEEPHQPPTPKLPHRDMQQLKRPPRPARTAAEAGLLKDRKPRPPPARNPSEDSLLKSTAPIPTPPSSGSSYPGQIIGQNGKVVLDFADVMDPQRESQNSDKDSDSNSNSNISRKEKGRKQNPNSRANQHKKKANNVNRQVKMPSKDAQKLKQTSGKKLFSNNVKTKEKEKPTFNNNNKLSKEPSSARRSMRSVATIDSTHTEVLLSMDDSGRASVRKKVIKSTNSQKSLSRLSPVSPTEIIDRLAFDENGNPINYKIVIGEDGNVYLETSDGKRVPAPAYMRQFAGGNVTIDSKGNVIADGGKVLGKLIEGDVRVIEENGMVFLVDSNGNKIPAPPSFAGMVGATLCIDSEGRITPKNIPATVIEENGALYFVDAYGRKIPAPEQYRRLIGSTVSLDESGRPMEGSPLSVFIGEDGNVYMMANDGTRIPAPEYMREFAGKTVFMSADGTVINEGGEAIGSVSKDISRVAFDEHGNSRWLRVVIENGVVYVITEDGVKMPAPDSLKQFVGKTITIDEKGFVHSFDNDDEKRRPPSPIGEPNSRPLSYRDRITPRVGGRQLLITPKDAQRLYANTPMISVRCPVQIPIIPPLRTIRERSESPPPFGFEEYSTSSNSDYDLDPDLNLNDGENLINTDEDENFDFQLAFDPSSEHMENSDEAEEEVEKVTHDSLRESMRKTREILTTPPDDLEKPFNMDGTVGRRPLLPFLTLPRTSSSKRPRSIDLPRPEPIKPILSPRVSRAVAFTPSAIFRRSITFSPRRTFSARTVRPDSEKEPIFGGEFDAAILVVERN